MKRRILRYHLAFNLQNNTGHIILVVENHDKPIDYKNLNPDIFNAIVNVLKEGDAFLEGVLIAANN